MPLKSMYLSQPLLDELNKRKITTYDSLLRELCGMPQIPQKISFKDSDDFMALKALEIGQSHLMLFVRDEKFHNEKPINIRKMYQIVKRATELTGYKFHVQGVPRGHQVFRVA